VLKSNEDPAMNADISMVSNDDQNKDKKDEVVDDLDVKSSFYLNVFGPIAKAIMAEMSVQKIDYMFEIQAFIKTLLAKFFARDTYNRILCDVVSSFFDNTLNLH